VDASTPSHGLPPVQNHSAAGSGSSQVVPAEMMTRSRSMTASRNHRFGTWPRQ
jgi:hypothetical protein